MFCIRQRLSNEIPIFEQFENYQVVFFGSAGFYLFSLPSHLSSREILLHLPLLLFFKRFLTLLLFYHKHYLMLCHRHCFCKSGVWLLCLNLWPLLREVCAWLIPTPVSSLCFSAREVLWGLCHGGAGSNDFSVKHFSLCLSSSLYT